MVINESSAGWRLKTAGGGQVGENRVHATGQQQKLRRQYLLQAQCRNSQMDPVVQGRAGKLSNVLSALRRLISHNGCSMLFLPVLGCCCTPLWPGGRLGKVSSLDFRLRPAVGEGPRRLDKHLPWQSHCSHRRLPLWAPGRMPCRAGWWCSPARDWLLSCPLG